jgi:hypothetical protein
MNISRKRPKKYSQVLVRGYGLTKVSAVNTIVTGTSRWISKKKAATLIEVLNSLVGDYVLPRVSAINTIVT